ncbi:MAG: DUF58 domain-containing protein [Lachnospiraceae bacterium]|nr:DUF58 domain-containing protein [Lachnospiraceae bacterium]
MLRNRVLYFLFVLAALYLAIMYDRHSLSVLLLFAVLLPGVSFLHLWYSRKRLSCRWYGRSRTVQKGEPLSFGVTLVSKSGAAGGFFMLELESREAFNGQNRKQKFQGFLLGQSRRELRLQMDAVHCGVTQVWIRSAKLCDWLRLFSVTLNAAKEPLELTVLPKLHLVEQPPVKPNPYALSGEEVYSAHRAGDDPAELFGVREYLPGDKLNRAHWKLTAKQDALMMKELGLPLDCSTVLLVELYESNGQAAIAEYEATIEAALSVSAKLLEEGRMHYLAWYQPENGSECRLRMESEEQLYEAIGFLLRVRCYPKTVGVVPFYLERRFRESYSNVLYFSRELTERDRGLLSQEKKNAYLTYFHIVWNDSERTLSEDEEKRYGIREYALHAERLEQELRKLGRLSDRLL